MTDRHHDRMRAQETAMMNHTPNYGPNNGYGVLTLNGAIGRALLLAGVGAAILGPRHAIGYLEHGLGYVVGGWSGLLELGRVVAQVAGQ